MFQQLSSILLSTGPIRKRISNPPLHHLIHDIKNTGKSNQNQTHRIRLKSNAENQSTPVVTTPPHRVFFVLFLMYGVFRDKPPAFRRHRHHSCDDALQQKKDAPISLWSFRESKNRLSFHAVKLTLTFKSIGVGRAGPR